MTSDPADVRATGRSPQQSPHWSPQRSPHRSPHRSPVRSPRRNRRSIRLRGYDYSQNGAYFITICTQNRECLFGEIVGGEMRLNVAGEIVADEWIKTAAIRDEIELDEWIVMPNHFHGILVIVDSGAVPGGGGDTPCGRGDPPGGGGDPPVAPTGPRPRSVGAVMAGFKSAVTKRINEWRHTPGAKLWQRNYWEHIVRNELELNRIREYIQNNPAKWELDKLFIHSALCGRPIIDSAQYGRPAGRPHRPNRPAGRPNEIRESLVEYSTEEWMA